MKYYILTLLALVVISCSENDYEEINAYDDNLYPITIGSSWIYKLDTVAINKNAGKRDTSISYLKEEIISSNDTQFAEVKIVLAQSYKSNLDQDEWKLTGYITTRKSDNRYIRNENNIPIIKMVYPATKRTSWDPTLFFDRNKKVNIGIDTFNMYQSWSADIVSTSESYTIDDIGYNDGIKVQLAEELDNSIIYEDSYEIYAPENGLAFAQYKILVDTEFGDEPLVNRFKYGFEIRKQLISSEIK